MSKQGYTELLQLLKAQYLPLGNIELLEDQELSEHPFLADLPFLSNITEIHVEKNNKDFIVSRISDKLFLSVYADKENCNLGILVRGVQQIAKEIRGSAI